MENPFSLQVGGSHYKSMKIQPVEFILANGLGFCEGNIIKYTCRYKQKGGVQDLRKVIHYAELLIKSLEQQQTPEEKLQELLYDKGFITKAAEGSVQLGQNSVDGSTEDSGRVLSVRLYE